VLSPRSLSHALPPIEGAIAVRFPALGEAATQLPWLCPCATSLLALARKPALAAWFAVRDDPGAVLLLVRQTARALPSATELSCLGWVRDPAILQEAVRCLQESSRGPESEAAKTAASAFGRSDEIRLKQTPACGGFVDWSRPGCRVIYEACLGYAHVAQRLAELSQRGDPEQAWVGGLLAPLGWLAICAMEEDSPTACLADPAFAHDPIVIQQRRWGYDYAGIARRLARRWRLPDWLRVVVGHLGLPDELALPMGADPDLFHLVQLAVGLVQQADTGLRLTVGGDLAATATALGLSFADLLERTAEWESPKAGARSTLMESASADGVGAGALGASRSAPILRRWTSPYHIPLLPDLLGLAAENLGLHDSPSVEQLERERDRLHQALETQRHGEAERLQALKLKALAEFAAGAAHEINNPLAVISGQAQYLLGREADPTRQRGLQTINGQAHRIHQLLNELMQFARPPRPQKQAVDLRGLLREVALLLSDLAAQRQVQLICPDPDPAVALHADMRLLRTALECLLRNAIEAAPPGGWAGVRVSSPDADRVEFVIEDNGSGPAPSQRDHLFDPFYSGRLAGRGRGFGLPTAWRLAREHGGDVRFDRPAEGPTRFILHLPRGTPNQEQETDLRNPLTNNRNGTDPLREAV
jgi:signal transduction histidine kinase